MKTCYYVEEVKDLLNLEEISTAQTKIDELNNALHKQGNWTAADRISIRYFHEVYPHIENKFANESKKPEIFMSKKTQKEMFRFFMRTSAIGSSKKSKEDG